MDFDKYEGSAYKNIKLTDKIFNLAITFGAKQ